LLEEIVKKTIQIKQVQTAEGFPQNSILCITEVYDGRLLIGTGNGLVLFDGFETVIPQNSLNSGNIRALFKLDNYTYLVQQNNSLLKFNLQNLSFSIVQKYLFAQFIELQNEGFSIITTDGILEFNKKGEEIRNIKISQLNQTKLVKSATQNLLFSTDNNLIQFTKNKISLEQKMVSKPIYCFDTVVNDTIVSILLTESGNTYLIESNKNAISQYRLPNQLFPNEKILDAHIIRESKIILLFEKFGLFSWDFKTGELISYSLVKQENQQMEMSYISHLYVDKSGKIWIGTDGYGLFYFKPDDQLFSSSKVQYPELHKNSALFVTSFFEDTLTNSVWIGTHLNGLIRLNRENNKTASFLLEKWGLQRKINTIRAIERIGNWLVLGTNQGILAWNLINNTKLWLSDYTVLTFNRAKKTNELVANTYNGILSIHLNKLGIPEIESIINNYGVGIFIENKNSILFGGEYDNIYQYKDEKIEIIDIKSFNNNKVRFIKSISFIQDHYWISTHKGLFVLNDKLEIVQVMNKKNGLVDEFIYGVTEDKDKFIWCSTNKGLHKIDPKTWQIWHFNKQNGLPENEFNTNAFYTCSDGTVYFGSVNGFVSFNSIKQEKPADLTSISIHSLFGSESKLEISTSIDGKEMIYMSKNQHFFRAQIQTINYLNPQNAQIAYFLDGIDFNWQVDLGIQNISYSNLPPGEYSLYLSEKPLANFNTVKELVKAEELETSDGVSLRVIQFHKEGYFWEYWWGVFILLLA